MNNFISDFEKWLTSSEEVKLDFQIHFQSFEEYSIEKDLFLYDENIVKNKLMKSSINLYLKRIEDYIKKYIVGFSFSAYKNFNEFSEKTNEESIVHFFDWFKDENLPNLKCFIEKSDEGRYNLKNLYNVIRYYDYIIRDTLESKNYEATLDFLVDFVQSVMTKAEELSIKRKDAVDKIEQMIKPRLTIPDIRINEEVLIVQPSQYTPGKLFNDLKSANKQTFSIELSSNLI